jgi:hypothetical protein
MLRTSLISAAAFVALAGYGFVFASANADIDYSAKPVFPVAKADTAKAPVQIPAGAQFRVASGKSAFRFVACNESRVVAGSHEERHCVSFSPSKGWGKSLRWIPAYQLLPLR